MDFHPVLIRKCHSHEKHHQKGFGTKWYTFDRIQYISYEIISSSFLLNLVNNDFNKNSNILSSFAVNNDELNDEITNITMAKLIEKLKEMGAKDQLLMFVTGPAGAGKSAAIEVAQ